MKLTHPLAKLTILFTVTFATMFARSLTAACVSTFFALVTLYLHEGGRKAAKSTLMVTAFTALMAVTNPLFVHEGATPLLFVGGRAYTLEAGLYGMAAGLSLSAVIVWLGLMNKLLPKQEQLYLFGQLSPKLALIVSMTLGIIPRMRRKLGQISDAQKTSGIYRDSSTRAQLRSAVRNYTALAAWSAENAADTALAMNARCYGKNKMTCSLKKRIRTTDIFIILLSTGLSIFALVLYRSGEPEFYPRIAAGSNEGAFAAVFAALSALPSILTVKEKLKWRLYTARSSASHTTAAKSLR